jgi:hypothetical protein
MDEINDKEQYLTEKHRMRAKLIFNPGAGAARVSPIDIAVLCRSLKTGLTGLCFSRSGGG